MNFTDFYRQKNQELKSEIPDYTTRKKRIGELWAAQKKAAEAPPADPQPVADPSPIQIEEAAPIAPNPQAMQGYQEQPNAQEEPKRGQSTGDIGDLLTPEKIKPVIKSLFDMIDLLTERWLEKKGVWSLTEPELENLCETASPVAQKYATEWMKKHPAEFCLAITAGVVIVPKSIDMVRIAVDRNKKKEKIITVQATPITPGGDAASPTSI